MLSFLSIWRVYDVEKIFLIMVSFTCFAATQPTTQNIFSLMNQRLSYMEDVALYKAQNHKAIEDLVREAVVIKKAGESANQYHLNSASIEALTSAQISAAKATQYRYRANLLSHKSTRTPRDLIKVVRPALITLNDKLNQELSSYLNAGHKITDKDWHTFEKTVNNPYLKASDKHMLFDALKEIKKS